MARTLLQARPLLLKWLFADAWNTSILTFTTAFLSTAFHRVRNAGSSSDLGKVSETLENRPVGEPPLESTYMVRIVCRYSHASVLRLRESKPMVYFGVCGRVHLGFGLWISPGRMALRSC